MRVKPNGQKKDDKVRQRKVKKKEEEASEAG